MHKPNHPRARRAPKTADDDIPTPPWATRSFFQYVAPELLLEPYRFIEPACGRGYMVKTLRQLRVKKVFGSDIKDYGCGFKVLDYTNSPRFADVPYDVLISNPPYKTANDFVERGLGEARRAVCMLVETLWCEGGKETNPRSRWHRILQHNPPAKIGMFTARVPFAHRKIIRAYPVFKSHSWVYWDTTCRTRQGDTRFIFIPPEAQRLLERDEDYA